MSEASANHIPVTSRRLSIAYGSRAMSANRKTTLVRNLLTVPPSADRRRRLVHCGRGGSRLASIVAAMLVLPVCCSSAPAATRSPTHRGEHVSRVSSGKLTALENTSLASPLAQLPVEDVSASVSPAIASAGRAVYTVKFRTSSQGALVANRDMIALNIPGMGYYCFGAQLTDVTTGQSAHVGSCGAPSFETPFPIGAGDEVEIKTEPVSVPSTSGSHTAGVYTSVDGEATAEYTLAPQKPVEDVRVALSAPVAGAARANYTIDFKTSSQGALVANRDTITLNIPGFSYYCLGVEVTDVTTGQSGQSGSCGGPTFETPVAIGAGDEVQVSTSSPVGVSSTAGEQMASVSTSVDGPGSAAFTLVQGTEISGTVSYDGSEGNLQPVDGSLVQACNETGCYEDGAPTASNGDYSIEVPTGKYTVTAFAPTSNAYSLGGSSIGPVDVTEATSGIDVTLPAIAPLEADWSFSGQTEVVPSVYWGSSAALTAPGCVGGSGLGSVSSINSQTGEQEELIGGLLESPHESGTYATTVPPLHPSHGTATIAVATDCAPRTALLPSSGPASGGNAVQISGEGFSGTTAVFFGETPAERFTVVSNDKIDAVAPPGSGLVSVSVTTPSGQITSESLADYAYLSVDSASPDHGPEAGGSQIKIEGEGFADVEDVYIGDSAASDVEIVSNNEMIVTTPPGTGAVPITVLTYDGGQSDTHGALFEYVQPGTPAAKSVRSGESESLYPGRAVHGNHRVARAKSGAVPASDTGTFTAVAPSAEVASTAANIVQHLEAECSGTACKVAQDDFGQVLSQADQSLENGTWLPASNISAGAQSPAEARPNAAAQASARPNTLGSETPASQSNTAAQELLQYVYSYTIHKLCPLGFPCSTGDQPVACFSADDCAQHGIPPGAPGYPDATGCSTGLHETPNCRVCLSGTTVCVPFPLRCPDGSSDTECARPQPPPQHVRVDPGGTVEDTNGDPVSGAKVTLLQSSTALGPFVAPPSGSPIMAPSENPETSTAEGVFDWDTYAGYYQVTASKEGCVDPSSPLGTTVSTSVFQVPPPQDNLLLTLSCPGEGPSPVPVVSGLSVGSGPAAGGTVTDLTGSGFTSASTVSFGGVPASAVLVLSPTEVQVTSPAGSGSVDVTVTTAGGTSATSGADQFSYVAPPVVSAVNPATGPTAGGNLVSITGSGFAASDRVTIGSVPAEGVAVVSPTQIDVVAPAGTGQVDITVTDEAGTSSTSSNDQYTYLDVPANTATPTISGTPTVGSTLACSAGTWSNSPTIYTYQWDRDGSSIADATTATYTVQSADIGHELACTVTASNASGPGQPATSSPVTGTEGPTSRQPGGSNTTGSNTTGSSGSSAASANQAHGGVLGEKAAKAPTATPAQLLARALKACNKLRKGRMRSACIAAARKHYRAQELALATKRCAKLKPGKKQIACLDAARKRYR